MSSLHTPPPPITFGQLTRDFIHDVTQTERGLLGTIIKMTLSPARVIDTYLFIDRSRFLKPTRYLVFCFGLAALQFFIVQAWYGQSADKLREEVTLEARQDVNEVTTSIRQSPAWEESDAAAELHAHYHRLGDQFAALRNEFRTLFAMLVIPVFALLYFGLFRRHGYHLAEAVVAATYIHAHVALLGFFMLPFLLLGRTAQDYELWSSLINNVTGLYLLVAVKQAFATRWRELLYALGWALLLIFLVALSLPSIIFIIGATARVLYTEAWYSFSPKFNMSLIQLFVLFPLACFLIWRLLLRRDRRPIATLYRFDLTLLAAALTVVALIVNFSFLSN